VVILAVLTKIIEQHFRQEWFCKYGKYYHQSVCSKYLSDVITATSKINFHLARLSKPDTLTLHGGNMRLKINYIADLSFAVLKKMVENEVINYRNNKFTFN
jgi:hypothetical protein